MSNKCITGYREIDKNFVLECNKRFDEILNNAVNTVCVEHNVKVLGITGPSCSGKTTLAKKVTDHCLSHGITVHKVSLDDFFKDMYSEKDTLDPKTTDFDSPDTMDMDAFEKFVAELKECGSAEKPVFDFLIGGRTEPETVTMKEGDILLFEGIQVLYPRIARVIHEMGGENIFIFPESDIKVGGRLFSNERVRLLRRLVRDCNFRASSVNLTFDMWANVRKNEEKNIFPYVDMCDIRIDTTQAYELNILKPYLHKYLDEFCEGDEYCELAREILESVHGIEEISSNVLPSDSIYKEFV